MLWSHLGRRRLRWIVLTCLLLLLASAAFLVRPPTDAEATSNYQDQARVTYPAIAGTSLDSCNLCHTANVPELNAYGADYQRAGHSFKAVELLDSDHDGVSNLAAIETLKLPGGTTDPAAAAAAEPASPAPVDVSFSTALVAAPAVTYTNWIYLPMAFRQPSTPSLSGTYKIIGWNDLGMHCMNKNYANLAVLPPYNNLYAEVIKQGAEPQLVTSGITVEYYIEGNTTSVTKSNFWQYAQQLFKLPQPLPADTGLTGARLAGQMIAQPGGYFKIEGVPMVPYLDSAPTTEYPYQIAHLTVKDTATGKVLAETRPVAPSSTEMHCENCHSDGQQGGVFTGNVETNILTLHDQLNHTTLMASRPVLCANCHGSNALGMTGDPNLPNLSRAMHGKHSQVLPTPNTMNTCYQCHPGTTTKCLRDVMYADGKTCISCHGDLAAVANPARNPWVDEPKCGTCHGSNYAEEPGKRYRDSKGHGGLFCETCHGSPHAILPTNQPNDNIQNIALQGHAGTLSDCTVCHGTTPSGPGPHGRSGGGGGGD
jgi:mono/diheme cytochrome c family protein